MPSWVILLVKFFLNVRGDVFLYVEFFHRLRCTFYSILLHILCHIGIFYYGFSVGHPVQKQLSTTSADLRH